MSNNQTIQSIETINLAVYLNSNLPHSRVKILCNVSELPIITPIFFEILFRLYTHASGISGLCIFYSKEMNDTSRINSYATTEILILISDRTS
jgi:hypothetical protein